MFLFNLLPGELAPPLSLAFAGVSVALHEFIEIALAQGACFAKALLVGAQIIIGNFLQMSSIILHVKSP